VVAIQKKFGVQIRDDERVRSIRTLGDVYQFIEVIYNEKKA
jgi:acyl carrier protein